MATSWGSNGFYILNGMCIYKGVRIPNPPKFNDNSINVTTIDNKVYLNGYELVDGEWKKTLFSETKEMEENFKSLVVFNILRRKNNDFMDCLCGIVGIKCFFYFHINLY